MAIRNPNRQFERIKDGAAKARLPFDKDVLLNIAFFLNHQYTEWVPDFNSIRMIPREEGEETRPRPVANKIMHFAMQEHAYALSNRPTVDVLPATDDPVDTSMAAIALAYLRWLAEPQVGDFDSELSRAAFWAVVGGEGFIKWSFNAREKRPDFCAVSPLDVYTDPYCTDFNKARYLIHSQFMDVEQVYDLYGKEIRPQALSRSDQTKAALLREMGQAPVLEGVTVNELWVPPGGRRYPKGLFVTWAGDEQLVEPGDFPYDHGKMPFTQIGSIPKLNTPHYTCAVTYMRAPQMELNKYHAQRIMVRDNFSNPKWWIPTELELNSDPDDSTSQILRGSGASGLEPKILQPTVFPEGTDGEWIRREMMDVAGLHEVSQAQVPGRVEAAKAIEMLKESDDTRLYELERTIKRTISEGFWMCLVNAKQYVRDEQIVQTYSREGLPEVRRFKATEFSPGMRVQVTMGTGLARSRAARTDQALLMWKDGIIQDPEVMAEIMEIPVGTIAPQRAYDIRLARNENLIMATGEGPDKKPGVAVTPNSWDAHDIHIREHNNFRKTSEFSALDNEIKQKFEFHVQAHEQMELEALAHEAKKQAVLQGLGLEPGQTPVRHANPPTGQPPADSRQQPPSAEPVPA